MDFEGYTNLLNSPLLCRYLQVRYCFVSFSSQYNHISFCTGVCSLPCDRYICEVPLVVVWVGATQDDFSSNSFVRVAVQVETEDRILNEQKLLQNDSPLLNVANIQI